MAEENVVVIEPEEEKKKKFPLLIIIFLLLILILLLILLAVVVVKKKKENKTTDINIEKIVKKLEKKNIPQDELNILIKKVFIGCFHNSCKILQLCVQIMNIFINFFCIIPN